MDKINEKKIEESLNRLDILPKFIDDIYDKRYTSIPLECVDNVKKMAIKSMLGLAMKFESIKLSNLHLNYSHIPAEELKRIAEYM